MNRDHRFVGRFAICALVVIATLELAACGGHGGRRSGATAAGGSRPAPASGLAYGSLPPRGTPRAGGTISVGQVAGSTPSYIFPIIPGANATPQTINLIQNLFLPLYNGPKGASPTIDYGLSIGRPPVFSDGDKTVTIAIKRGFKWSDGTPVDADDMVFEIDLLKAAVADRAANWSQYTPGQFPTSVVSATAPSRYKLVIKLDRAYNPNYFLDDQLQDSNGVYPLPATTWNIDRPGGPHLDYTNPANAKKIYDFLSSQGANESGFATNPLWKDVDGPYKLSSFSATDGSYRLTPNPHYGGGPGPYATILATTYPSIAAQLSALRSGGLDVGSIDFAQLGAVRRLRAAGFSVFGGPSFGWLGGVINFEDTTGHFDKIIKQPYVRQALAHLIDQPAYVKSIFNGAAAVNYGPVPNLPVNPFTPANNTSVNGPYPYDPAAAAVAAEGARMEGRAERSDDLPEGRQRRRRVRCRDPGGDAVDVQLGRSAAIGVADQRARRSRVRVRGQDGDRRHRGASVTDVRLPVGELRRRRPECRSATATTGRSPTTAPSSTTTTRPRIRRSIPAACSTPVVSRTRAPTR